MKNLRIMKKKYGKLVFWGTCAMVLCFAGAEASTGKRELSQGAQIYIENCRVCHGDKGNGQTFVANVLKPSPRNFTNPMVINTLTREQMITSITNGRPGTAMMPWKTILSANDIRAVVDHIRSTFMKP